MCEACRPARREELDRLDDELTELLLRRARLAAGVVADRLRGAGAVRDGAREAQVLARAARRARSPGERRLVEDLYGRLLAGVRAVGRAEADASPAPPAACPGAPRVVAVGAARFGGGALELIAGPCAVEDEAQLEQAAAAAREAGAKVLRGGAWKPRTSPRAFQGHGAPALAMLRRAADRHGLALVTEVVEPALAGPVAEVADMLQVGARSMHVPALLRAVGRAGRPVLLKRGMAATVEELVQAVDYVRDGGAEDVVLCLRGIRTFCDASRFTLDLAAGPVLRARTGLPVVVDPSHAAGRRALVAPLALAAAAAGADGLMIEVHPDPGRALSDGPQALRPDDLLALAARVRAVEAAARGPAEVTGHSGWGAG